MKAPVTVPFKDKLIVNYFESNDDNFKYLIDYENSELKDTKFVTYISNVKIPANVHISENVSYDEKSKLLLSWLNYRSMLQLDTLTITLLDLIFSMKGVKASYPSIFSTEEKQQFVDENNEMLIKIIAFLDSILLHCQVQYGFVKQEELSCICITDNNFVPRNLANLFAIDDFFLYYSVPATYNSMWFKSQFEGNNAIIRYFYLNKNPLTAFLSCVQKGTVNPDSFNDFIAHTKTMSNEKI